MADPAVNILLTAKDMTKGVLGGVGNALAGIGKLALGAAVGGVAALAGVMAGSVRTTLDWGNQLDSLQDLLGTTAEESAGLAVMANRIGLSSDEMGRSLSIMTRGLLDVEGQAGPSAKAMDGLGISIYDANGAMKDAPTLFQEVSDVLGKMPDGFAKSSAMMDIFGRSGVEMGDLLAAAADGGVAKFQEEAGKLGLSFSQEKVDSIIEFGKQTEFLKSSFQGIAAEIGSAVLPMFTSFLQDSVMPFVQTYGPLLAAWLGENIPKAVEFLAGIWTTILQPAIQTVWAWMSGTLIPFLQGTVFPWLKVHIPIALQFLSDVWTNVLKPAIEAVWAWLSGTLMPFLIDVVFPWLNENIPKALRFLSDVWTNVLKPAIEAVWSWLKGTLIPFLTDLASRITGNYSGAVTFWSDIWENTLLPAITAIWEFIDAYLMPIFETIGEIMSIVLPLAIKALQGAWENVLLPALEKVWEFVNKYISPALTWLMDKVVKPLATALSVGLKGALDLINRALAYFKSLLEKIKLPAWLTPGSPTPLEMGIRGIIDAMSGLNRMALPGLSLGLATVSAGPGMSARIPRAQTSNRLTVYGGLHLHGIENEQDLLASLNDLMIG